MYNNATKIQMHALKKCVVKFACWNSFIHLEHTFLACRDRHSPWAWSIFALRGASEEKWLSNLPPGNRENPGSRVEANLNLAPIQLLVAVCWAGVHAASVIRETGHCCHLGVVFKCHNAPILKLQLLNILEFTVFDRFASPAHLGDKNDWNHGFWYMPNSSKFQIPLEMDFQKRYTTTYACNNYQNVGGRRRVLITSIQNDFSKNNWWFRDLKCRLCDDEISTMFVHKKWHRCLSRDMQMSRIEFIRIYNKLWQKHIPRMTWGQWGFLTKVNLMLAKKAQFTLFLHGVNLDLTCNRLLW